MTFCNFILKNFLRICSRMFKNVQEYSRLYGLQYPEAIIWPHHLFSYECHCSQSKNNLRAMNHMRQAELQIRKCNLSGHLQFQQYRLLPGNVTLRACPKFKIGLIFSEISFSLKFTSIESNFTGTPTNLDFCHLICTSSRLILINCTALPPPAKAEHL